MQDFTRYEKYRDSRIEWIGKIPLEWDIKKIKYIGCIYNGDSLNESQKEKYESIDIEHRPYISSKDINADVSSINYDNGLRIPKEELGLKFAPANTSLFCIEGGSAGKKIAFTDKEVCFVNKLSCFNPGAAYNSKYFFYSLKAAPFQTQFKLAMSGLIGGVAISSIKNFFLTLPSSKEQNSIVAFLDQNIEKIDKAIALKRNQIDLLKERKKIIIHDAVTCGLNHEVSMSDSGIAWIRDVPSHWRIIRFKNLFSQSKLPTNANDDVVTSYRDGQVTLRSNRRLEGYTEAILEHGYQGIRKGQLVLNSMDAFEGAIGVSDSNGKCTPEYVVCDPKSPEIEPEYFALLLREMALAKYIQVICNAVRQRAVRIRFNNLARQFLVVPPHSEQINIIKYIDVESKNLDKVISVQERQIELLKEYKITLIDNAVTGKIKI